MKIVQGEEVRAALKKYYRTYLCGKHLIPESFDAVETDGMEIGITHYVKYTLEKPHYHKWNNEYNIILSGKVKVLLIDENKEFEFHEDDMYVIESNMKYITKAQKGTRVIFVKSPGGNDKCVTEMTEDLKEWGKKW